MAAPVLVSKIYALNNNANKNTKASILVSGSTTGAAKTGTAQATITGANTIQIAVAAAGTYAAINTALGSRDLINYNGTCYHISAKSGSDTLITLTVTESPGLDATPRNWAIGGPFSTMADAMTVALSSAVNGGYDRILASNEGGAAETITAALAPTNAGGVAGDIECIGYGATETDGLMYQFTQATGSAAVISTAMAHWRFKNLAGHTSTTGICFQMGNGVNDVFWVNCRGKYTGAGTSGAAFSIGTSRVYIEGCAIEANTNGTGAIICNGVGSRIIGNTIRGGTANGISIGGIGITIERNLIVLGANSTNGIKLTAAGGGVIQNNTIDGGGFTSCVGIDITDAAANTGGGIYNNIIRNVATGINLEGVTLALQPNCDYNFFYTIGTSNYSNTSGGTHDVTLSADPHIDRANLNYNLNNTSGGGASVRAVAWPGAFPAGTLATTTVMTNYMDGGAVQHQDSSGIRRSGTFGGIIQ